MASVQGFNTPPLAITNASFKRQSRNIGVTEIIELPNRGQGLVIDSGWREVADTSLRFIERYLRVDSAAAPDYQSAVA